MWSPIRSRARTALTVCAVLLTVTLVVVGILFVVQRIFPTQSYTYQLYQLDVTPSAPWHPGQSLSLVWVPTSAGSSGPDAPPRSVTCSFSLYGPYPTHAAAQVDLNAVAQGNYTLAASGPSLTLSTDLAAPAPTPVAYALPDTLAPDYYVAVDSVQGEDEGGGGSLAWVVEVTG